MVPGVNQRVPGLFLRMRAEGSIIKFTKGETKLTKLANDLNILDLERQVSATDTTFCDISICRCSPYPIMVALSCDKVQCLQSIFLHPEGIYKIEIDELTNNSSQYKKERLNKKNEHFQTLM